jgi:hypothetical protein
MPRVEQAQPPQVIDYGRLDNRVVGQIGKTRKSQKYFLKWPSFSGANWKSKYIRVSRDLYPKKRNQRAVVKKY